MKGKEYLIEGYNLYPPRVQGMLLLKQELMERDLWFPNDDEILNRLIREYSMDEKA